MNNQKEIEEFLELDKSTLELAEGYASCLFSEGEEIGKIKGETKAWQKIMNELMPMLKDLPKEDKLHPIGTFIIGKCLDAQKQSTDAYKTWKPDEESLSLKKAYLRVLKKKLK